MPHASIPQTEPVKLRSGDSWQWDRYLGEDHLPSDGWQLVYHIRRGTDDAIAITANDAGDHFEIRVDGNATEHYPPGLYRIVGRVFVTSGDRHTIHEGYVVVQPDPIHADASFAEQMVASIEAELLALSSTGTTSPLRRWKQGDREEEMADLDTRQSLMRELGYWREQVRQERGGPVFQPIRERYVYPR